MADTAFGENYQGIIALDNKLESLPQTEADQQAYISQVSKQLEDLNGEFSESLATQMLPEGSKVHIEWIRKWVGLDEGSTAMLASLPVRLVDWEARSVQVNYFVPSILRNEPGPEWTRVNGEAWQCTSK